MASLDEMTTRIFVLAGLVLAPASALLPSLWAPIPAPSGHAREIAGYFQALTFARQPIASFYTLTPEESLSAIHLHSILSSPLVALGYPQGGRLISLFAAILSSIFIYYICSELMNSRTGLLATTVLWANPLFLRFASRFWPETVSILLTTAAVAATIRHLSADDGRWFAAVLVLVALGIANHRWEASIIFPISAILIYRGKIRDAGLTIAWTAIGLIAVSKIVALQNPPSGLMSRAVWNHTGLLVSLEWWTRGFPSHTFYIAVVLILPLALVSIVISLYWFQQTREETWLIVGAWLASGAAIPILLAGGYNHYYYAWGMVVPFSIFTARAVLQFQAQFGMPSGTWTVVAGLMIIMAVGYGGMFEAGIGPISDETYGGHGNTALAHDVEGFVTVGEPIKAGRDIRSRNVNDVRDVVFIGPWGQNASKHYFGQDETPYGTSTVLSQTLIYSELSVHEFAVRPNDGIGPRFANKSATDCDVAVIRDGADIRVESC